MKLVILDRDGVINEDSDAYITSVDEFIPLPGSMAAIARLNQAGYTVAIATNQSGIARNYLSQSTLKQIHAALTHTLALHDGRIDYIALCPHGPDDQCDCRKPKPGLLRQIAAHYGTSLKGVPVIGDSLRDLQAAQAVGASPMLVRTGKGERTIAAGEGLEGVPIFDDLAAAVATLLHGH